MANLFGVCTPAQYEIIHARWQRISRFGFVPFVLLVSGTYFLLMIALMEIETWLAFRAHHIEYSLSMDLSQNLSGKAGLLVLSFLPALIYWFGIKRHVTRYQRQFGNPTSDRHS